MTSAQSSPLDIRPLLIYYGVVAFAKAVVMSRALTAISTLVPAHGLKDISAGNAKLSNLVCSITDAGTFHEFSNTVSNLGRIHCYDDESMPLELAKPFDAVSSLSGSRVDIKDVLSRIPGLSALYTRTFGEPAKLLNLSLFNVSGNDHVRIRIDDSEIFHDRNSLIAIISRLRQAYPFLDKWQLVNAGRGWGNSILEFDNFDKNGIDEFSSETLVESNWGFAVKKSDQIKLDLGSITQPMAGGLSGGHPHAIQPLHNCFLSEYAIEFIGAYLLGSLVRYRPQTWQHSLSRSATLSSPADDRELALIEKFLEEIIGSFPGLAVQVLRAP